MKESCSVHHKVANATGEMEANIMHQFVKSWGISDNIKAICYYTTFSNTGAWKGACVRLEELLNKKLIMCACRHHILELIINCAYLFCVVRRH